jgi:hypothetical protein
MGDRHLLGVSIEKAHLGHRFLACDESFINGIRTDGRGDIATVASHIDQGLLDADLAKGKVNINAWLRASADDRGLAGQGGSTSQAINLPAIAIWTAKGS